MNKIILIGNLSKDVEVIKGQDSEFCKLNIAVNANYTKADGTRPVDFFTIIVWQNLAKICKEYLHKGSKIAVSGKLQNRSWEADDGTKKYITEIVAEDIEFLTPKDREHNTNVEPIEDEDLPF